MKIDLPQFDGELEMEDLLNWLKKLDKCFDYTHTPEENKVKLVAYKFHDGALTWWDKKKSNMRKMGKPLIMTWPRMRKMIQDPFLPINYEQILWEQLHHYTQRTMTIHQCTAEYQRLQARTNLSESPYYQMVRYVNGLRKGIKDRVEMYIMNTIIDAISLA